MEVGGMGDGEGWLADGKGQAGGEKIGWAVRCRKPNTNSGVYHAVRGSQAKVRACKGGWIWVWVWASDV